MDLITYALAKKNGGGGQLPTPTAQDVGKVATVVEETSKGAVIVPEQTGGGEIQNANVSLFTVGAICVTTYDGADYVGTVIESKGLPKLIINDDAYLSLVNNVISLNTSDVDSHTISVNLASTSVSYGLSAPSCGALVVNGTWNEDWTTCTLDKTWQELFDADFAVLNIKSDIDDEKNTYILMLCHIAPFGDDPYFCKFAQIFGSEIIEMMFKTDTANGYPVYTYEGE